MICQACGGQCAQYDQYRVCCRRCHTIWTLPEHADKATAPVEAKPGQAVPVRLVKAPRFPAWLPGAVLGGLGLLVSIVEVIL
jgi:hypothetical protein